MLDAARRDGDVGSAPAASSTVGGALPAGTVPAGELLQRADDDVVVVVVCPLVVFKVPLHRADGVVEVAELGRLLVDGEVQLFDDLDGVLLNGGTPGYLIALCRELVKSASQLDAVDTENNDPDEGEPREDQGKFGLRRSVRDG